MSSPLRTPQHGRPGSITRASSSKSNKPPTYSSSATKENRPDGGMHLHHSAVMMSPGASPTRIFARDHFRELTSKTRHSSRVEHGH